MRLPQFEQFFFFHFVMNLKVYRSVLLRGRKGTPLGSSGSDGGKGKQFKVVIYFDFMTIKKRRIHSGFIRVESLESCQNQFYFILKNICILECDGRDIFLQFLNTQKLSFMNSKPKRTKMNASKNSFCVHQLQVQTGKTWMLNCMMFC